MVRRTYEKERKEKMRKNKKNWRLAFALADEVRDLLLNPKDSILLERAQRYTVDFAEVKGIFVGL